MTQNGEGPVTVGERVERADMSPLMPNKDGRRALRGPATAYIQRDQDTMPTGIPLQALPFFYFTHIQKAAGTTVRAMLWRMFGREFVLYTSAGEFQRQKQKENPDFRLGPKFYAKLMLIGGHFPFSHPLVERNRFGRRRVFLSVWRDPVRRVVSFYDYVRRHQRHFLHAELAGLTLREAVGKSEQFRSFIVDHQLHYTFGTRSLAEAEAVMRDHNFIVATTENLEEFFDAVSAISGLPRPPRLPRMNTSAQGDDTGLEPAAEQADYAAVLEEIAALNSAESEFIARYLSRALVTTSLKPFVAPMRVRQEGGADSKTVQGRRD